MTPLSQIIPPPNAVSELLWTDPRYCPAGVVSIHLPAIIGHSRPILPMWVQ